GSLPAVGEALKGAFEATAIFFVIDAIVQASEKLEAFVSDTFIFTEAEKAAAETVIKVNEVIAKQGEGFKKRQKAYAGVGLEGSALLAEKFGVTTQKAEENAAALRRVQDQAYGLRDGLRTVPEALNSVNNELSKLYEGLPQDQLAKKLLPSDATK